jgi:hypothetical protein
MFRPAASHPSPFRAVFARPPNSLQQLAFRAVLPSGRFLARPSRRALPRRPNRRASRSSYLRAEFARPPNSPQELRCSGLPPSGRFSARPSRRASRSAVGSRGKFRCPTTPLRIERAHVCDRRAIAKSFFIKPSFPNHFEFFNRPKNELFFYPSRPLAVNPTSPFPLPQRPEPPRLRLRSHLPFLTK